METFSTGPFDPERELRQLEDAVRTAQSELDSMAERAASTEQAILQFQSMMLDDEGMMNEVRFCIKQASAPLPPWTRWASVTPTSWPT